jgi:hypothetical protein
MQCGICKGKMEEALVTYLESMVDGIAQAKITYVAVVNYQQTA